MMVSTSQGLSCCRARPSGDLKHALEVEKLLSRLSSLSLEERSRLSSIPRIRRGYSCLCAIIQEALKGVEDES